MRMRTLMPTFVVGGVIGPARGATMCAVRKKRRDCFDYLLVGKCKHGDRCYFSHDRRLPNPHVGYVPVPSDIGLAMVIGRGGANIKRIINSVSRCCVQPSYRPGRREVEVVTVHRGDFIKVKDRLERLFSKMYPSGPKWCLLNPEGIGDPDHAMFEYEPFRGHLLPHFKDSGVEYYYLKLSLEKQSHQESDEAAGESEVITEAKLSQCLENLTILPDENRYFNVLGDVSLIAKHLRGALQWFQQNRCPNQRAKLEVRFGKMIWHGLPQDTENAFNLDTLAKIVDSDLCCRISMNTSVEKSRCCSLQLGLKNGAEESHTIETYDFNMVLKTPAATTAGERKRSEVDIRVKLEGGRLSIVMVKLNERKLVTFENICLHRAHDYRIALSYLEKPGEEILKKMESFVGRIKIPSQDAIQFPFCEDPEVNLVRHKERSTFVMEDGYIITVSHIKAKEFHWSPSDDSVVILKPEDYTDDHWEVELNSVLWECAFGGDCHLTAEDVLCQYMERPSISPALQSKVPSPWDPSSLMSDVKLVEMLKQVDQISEHLG